MQKTGTGSSDALASQSWQDRLSPVSRKSEDSVSNHHVTKRSPFLSSNSSMSVSFGDTMDLDRRKSEDSFEDLSLMSKQIIIRDNSVRLSDSPVRPMTREYAQAVRDDLSSNSSVLKKICERRPSAKDYKNKLRSAPPPPRGFSLP